MDYPVQTSNVVYQNEIIMNTQEIKMLDRRDAMVYPIKKDEIKRKLADDKAKQDKLRMKYSNRF